MRTASRSATRSPARCRATVSCDMRAMSARRDASIELSPIASTTVRAGLQHEHRYAAVPDLRHLAGQRGGMERAGARPHRAADGAACRRHRTRDDDDVETQVGDEVGVGRRVDAAVDVGLAAVLDRGEEARDGRRCLDGGGEVGVVDVAAEHHTLAVGQADGADPRRAVGPRVRSWVRRMRSPMKSVGTRPGGQQAGHGLERPRGCRAARGCAAPSSGAAGIGIRPPTTGLGMSTGGPALAAKPAPTSLIGSPLRAGEQIAGRDAEPQHRRRARPGGRPDDRDRPTGRPIRPPASAASTPACQAAAGHAAGAQHEPDRDALRGVRDTRATQAV